MDILLPKLLVQTLRQRPRSELARRKARCRRVSPPRSRRTRENKCAALSIFVEVQVLERQDGFACESECPDDIGVNCTAYLFWCDFQEWATDVVCRVPDCDANLGLRTGPEL